MITWNVKNNVVSELRWKGENVILPWGFETADSSGFFSLEKGQGWRFRVEKEKMSWDKRRLAMDTVVRMKDSKLALSFRDRIIQPRTLSRSVTAECLQESYLLDFVLRFRFAKKFFDYSEIAGRRFRHQNTNLYHEYPVKQARLKWKGRKGGVLVRVTHSNVPNNMKPVLYVRDQGEEWVVHARMLPRHPKRKVIKLCNRWCGTRALPQFLSDWMLRQKGWEKALLRRGEREPFHNPFLRVLKPYAYGLARLPKGQKLGWDVRVIFS